MWLYGLNMVFVGKLYMWYLMLVFMVILVFGVVWVDNVI